MRTKKKKKYNKLKFNWNYISNNNNMKINKKKKKMPINNYRIIIKIQKRIIIKLIKNLNKWNNFNLLMKNENKLQCF